MKKKKKTLLDVLDDDTLTDKEKYDWYINKSEEWEKIRALVLARDGHKCKCCGREERLSVHHATYEHLFHEMEHLEDLITICSVCHLAIHRAKSNRSRFRKQTKE